MIRRRSFRRSTDMDGELRQSSKEALQAISGVTMTLELAVIAVSDVDRR